VDKTPLSLFPVEPIWTLALNNQLAPGAAPAFDDGRAFFALEGRRIVAYDLAQGRQLWITDAAPATDPAVSTDLLFVVESGRIVALRTSDGSPSWEQPSTDPLAVPPVFDNGWLVAATLQGEVIARRATDGTLMWRQSIGSPAHARPALAADRVYVPTEDGRVVALRVDTGERVWEHRVGGAVSDILALDDRLFAGSKDNYMYAFRTEDGEPDWRWRTGGDVIGRPVVDRHAVYFVSLDNILWALNRSNGNQRWKRALPLRPIAGPLHVGRTLVVSGFAPKLPGYKVEDGSPAGDVPVTGEIAAPVHATTVPDIFGDVVFVTTRDIVKGATVTAVARSIEPALVPTVPVLPKPITLTVSEKP
jgi:outer membrane protein assembly factor BamB